MADEWKFYLTDQERADLARVDADLKKKRAAVKWLLADRRKIYDKAKGRRRRANAKAREAADEQG